MANGKSKTQKQVFEKLYPVLLSVARRYTGEDMLAEDAVTVAFIKAFRHSSDVNYVNDYTFYNWIKRIVINQVISDLRQHKRYVELDHFNDAIAVDSDDSILSGLQARQLMQMIDKLPVNMKTVFMLYAVEDYSHNEIAALLNTSESNSKVLLYRAKNALKELIKTEEMKGNSHGRLEA